MFTKLRTYKSFKVLLLATITASCIIFSSCEDDVVYEPVDTPSDDDCQGSYCKLDKNGEDEINFFALLINSTNPETF
jgi:hypothetical protein